MKRLFSILSSTLLLISLLTLPASASTSIRAGFDGGVVTVQFNKYETGHLSLTLYDAGAAVFQQTISVAGSDTAQIGLPIRNLHHTSYTTSISFQDDNGAVSATSLTIITGVDAPVSSSGIGNDILPNTPQMSRAIMVPYAKVYNSDTMTGTPTVQLKRHDFVQVIRDYGNVAYVKYFIQSGNGTFDYQPGNNGIVSGVDYSSDDDLTGTGYIYTNAFNLPLSSQVTDTAREAVELAYSRLGTKGVYNQMKRYIEYYTDCSAFVSYCYFNAGLDWGTDTTCNGILQWAVNQADNKILWDAGINETAGIDAISGHPSTHSDEEGNVPSLTLSTSTDSGLDAGNLVTYARLIDSTVVAAMKPGDLVFFNHFQTVRDQFDCNLGQWQIIERAYGVDHVGIVVGVKDNMVTIIHSTPSSSNPEYGVVMKTMTISQMNTIVRIVRPTGCEEIDSLGEFMADFSGEQYADVGDLCSPIPGLNAGNMNQITGPSAYGPRIHPVTGSLSFHTGVDIGGRFGATMGADVLAAADGEIVMVSNTCTHNTSSGACSCGGGYGNYIVVQHSNGIKTRYAHLSRIDVVIGQVVQRGAEIGAVGTTGRSTGPHLHFEVIRNGQTINPLLHLNVE